MEEKSLKEQLEKLKREQTETENAYSENLGKIDESILVAWLQEILDREVKIKELKGKMAEQSAQFEENDMTEEKSLVNTERLGIIQKIRQIEAELQHDFNHTPGLSTEALGDLREIRMKKYENIVQEYIEKKNAPEENENKWKLEPEAKKVFQQEAEKILKEKKDNFGKTNIAQEREN